MAKKNPKPRVSELFIDVLKPSEISIINLASSICEYKSVEKVDIEVYDVDARTENIHILITGKNLKFDNIKQIIEENGSVIHSVDGVLVENK
jgi:hypothetical protein